MLGGLALAFSIVMSPSGGVARAAENDVISESNDQSAQSDEKTDLITSPQTNTSAAKTAEPAADMQTNDPQDKQESSSADLVTADSAEPDNSEKPEDSTGTEPAEEPEKEPVYRLANNRLYRTDDGTAFTGTGFARMEDGSYYYVVNGRWNS